MSDKVCPKCGIENHVVGIEIQGVYDGVLFWQCADCGARWHRLEPTAGRLYRAAAEYMDDDEIETPS